jgi:nitronate monooxygenase
MVARLSPEQLAVPVVQAPMGGGPSTPALAAAVSEAGGLGFLAAGYKAPDAVRADVEATRAATAKPFGVELPLVATGEIMTGWGVAAALAAGAAAAQLGTAFMRTPEAATSAPHRAALADPAATTALTRAFTGRTARGVANRFLREHAGQAPPAYPEVHNLTAPLRAAARAGGDADGMHLWAGQGHPLADEVPAGELVRRLAEEAQIAVRDAADRLRGPAVS